MKSSRPPPQGSYFKTKKIFVGGVPPEMEKKPLEEYFSQFGEVSCEASFHAGRLRM